MSNSEKRFLSGLLDRIFSTKKAEHLFESKGKGRKSLEERRLSMEPLEERQLLSVTPAEYAALQTTFSSFNLKDYSSVNVIEIDNTSLTSSSLRDAISQAASTPQDDVVVVRTSADQFTIDLQGEALDINIDSDANGSVSVIGYGDSMFRLVNGELNVINVQSGDVNLGAINLISKSDGSQLKNVSLNVGIDANVTTQRVLFSSNYSVDTTEITDDSVIAPSNAGTPDAAADDEYYSAEFQLTGSKWVYVTGLSQYEAQDVENNINAGTVEFYVGEFYDAEKDGIKDSQLCWAATASNMLTYTSWGYAAGESTDDIFDYFKANFTDGGSRAEFGLEWFMNGEYEAQGGIYEALGFAQYVGTGGNLYSDYKFDDYGGLIESDTFYSKTNTSPMVAVENYLRNGYGIGIGLGWYTETTDDDTTTTGMYGELTRNGGHAITMWGFVYDDAKTVGATDYYVSVIVSDSDDDYGLGRTAPDRLQTYGVTWRDTEMQYEFNDYGGATFKGIIEDFQYIGQAPDEAKSDDLYEVNNTIAQVEAFTEAATNSPNLGLIAGTYTIENLRMLDGIDWFKFELPQNASLYDYVSVSYKATATNYLELYLYDANGALVASYDQIGAVEKISLGGLSAGDYFIKVVGNVDKPVRNYTLTIQTCSDDPYELNNTREQVDAAPERTDANHEIVNPTSPNLGVIFEDRYTVSNLIMKQTDPSKTTEIDGFRFEMTGTGGENSYILLEYIETYLLENDCDLDLYVYKLADEEFYNTHGSAYWGEVVGSSTNNQIPKNLVEDTDDRTLVKKAGLEYVSLEGWEPGVYYVKVVGFVNAENTWNYKMTVNLRDQGDPEGIGVSASPDLHFSKPDDRNWGSFLVASSLTEEQYYQQNLETTRFVSDTKFYDADNIYLNFSIKATSNADVDKVVYVAVYVNGVRYDRFVDATGTEKMIMAEDLDADEEYTISNLSIFSLIDAEGNGVELKHTPDDVLDEDIANYVNSIEVVIDPDNTIEEYNKANNTVSASVLVFENSDDPYVPNGTRVELDNNTNEEYCPILGPVVATSINDLKIIKKVDVVGNEIKVGSTEDWFSFELLKKGEFDSKVEIQFELKNIVGTDNQTILDGDLDLYVYRLNERYPDGLELVGSSLTKNDVETVALAGMPAGTYYIRVIGFNGQTNSYDLTIVGAEIDAPTPPTNLAIDSKVNDILGVSWNLNEEEYILSCEIQWIKIEPGTAIDEIDWSGASSKTVGRNVTRAKLTGLESGATYAFRVCGTNAIGTSDWATYPEEVAIDEFLNPSDYYGLIIGIDDYYGSDNDISYTTSDARAVYNALLTDPHWAESNITVLTNTHATKAAITNSLRTIAANADKNDVVFVYFAGSGFNATVAGDPGAYLCTYVNSTSWNGSLDGLITNVELTSLLNNIAAGEKQIVLEVAPITTYSYDYQTQTRVAISTPFVYTPMVDSLLTLDDQVSVITAAADYEYILGDRSSKTSYFGTYMVEAMTTFNLDGNTTVDIDRDGRLSMEELYAYVSPRVYKASLDAAEAEAEAEKEANGGTMATQTPTFDANRTVSVQLDGRTSLVLENEISLIAGTSVVVLPAGSKVVYQRNDTFRVGNLTVDLPAGVSFLSDTIRLTYQGSGVAVLYLPESIVMAGTWKEAPSITVTTLLDVSDSYDGQISLREAIAYAQEGETIRFDENLANQQLTLLKTLTIDKGITIDGESNQIVISGQNKLQLFKITSDSTATLIGLTLTGGYTSATGGAILNEGSLYLANMLIHDNGSSATGSYITAKGGAIYNAVGAKLTVTNSTIAANLAGEGGGIYNRGDLNLYNTILFANFAETNDDYANYGNAVVKNSLIGIDPSFKDLEGRDFRLTELSTNAIDKGDDLYARTLDYTLTTDIRGIDRFLYNSVDIGAYEYYDVTGHMEMSTEVTTIYDVVDSTDGKTSLREAVANAGGTNIAYVTLADGTALTTNSGVSLIVKNGVFNTYENGAFLIAANGSATAIADGTVLTLADGIAKVTYNAGVFSDDSGKAVVIPDGAVVSVGGTNYNYSSKKYTEYALKTGTKITLANGTTAMVEDGINVLQNEILSTKVTFNAAALRSEMDEAGLSGNITVQTTDEIRILREVAIDASNVVGLTITATNTNRLFNVMALSSKVAFNNVALTNGFADFGGAIYAESGNISLNSSSVQGSMATFGGAIYVATDAVVTISKSTLINNEATSGGAIYNEGTLTITAVSMFDSNTAQNDGGALYNAPYALTTIDGQTTLYRNAAQNDGGAIFNANDGLLQINAAFFAQNQATADGGAIANEGEAIVLNAQITVNAARYGGGIYTTGKLQLINATVVNNFARSAYGGGLYVGDYSESYGDSEDVVVIQNTIFAFNQDGEDLETINTNVYSTEKTANLPEMSYSLVSGSIQSSGIKTVNSVFNKDPLFVLQSSAVYWANWDLSLQSDSPAIKTGVLASYVDFDGVTTFVSTDVRGRSRGVTGVAVDMGAYERSIETPSLIVTTVKDVVDPNDGETSLREALMYAAMSDLEGYAPSDERVISFKAELSGQTIYWTSTYEINYDDSWFVKVSTDGLAEGITVSGADLQIGTDAETGLPTYTGMFKMLGGDIEFNGLRFVDSTGANNYGGVFTLSGGTLHLTTVEMSGNQAKRGGAIQQSGGTLYLVNSLVHNNKATQFGGAIQTTGGYFYMRNSTVAANSAAYYGGIDSYRTYVVIQNSVIAKNECVDKVEANFTDLEIGYSLVGVMYQGNTYNGKNGNLVGTPISPVDPGFVGDDAGNLTLPENFQLTSDSAAVNAGNNNYANDSHGVPLVYDFAGNDRVVSVVDMGAFESEYADVPSTVVTTLSDVVDKNDGFISLREAIENAKSLKTPITFSENLVGNIVEMELGTFRIESSVKIDGSNFLGGITIDANRLSNIFRVVNGASLELISLQLTGGNSSYGGAIYVENGSVSMTNTIVYGNTGTENGGAIYLKYGSLNLLNSTVAGNASGRGTGGIYSGSDTAKHSKITLGNSIVANNYNGDGYDLDYYCFLTAPFTDVVSVASLVGSMNAARAIDSSMGNLVGTPDSPIDADFVADPYFIDGVLSNVPDLNLNETSVAVNAGANYLVGQPGTRTELNAADALFGTSKTTKVVAKDLDLNDRIVAGTVDMGAFEFQNVAVVEQPSVVVTTLEDLQPNILDGVISLREAIDYAGTVYIDENGKTVKLGTTITFDDSLAGQTLTLNGDFGAILIEKGITIDAGALKGGITIDADSACRVIQVVAPDLNVVLINLTITGGSATYGAGIYQKSGNLTVVNSLIYDNTAPNGYGAAIRSDSGTLKLVNCTVTKNEAGYYYGGIYSRGASVTLQNTIISQNTVGNVPSTDIFVMNLASTSSFVSRASEAQSKAFNGLNGNLFGTAQNPLDPYFVDWDANDFSLNRVDGDTGTISPAINTGDNGLAVYPNGTTIATDHNGDYRFIGGKVDMGAYESILGETEIPSLVVTTAEDVVNDTDGLISLREAIAYAGNYGLSNIITFSEALTGKTIYLNEALSINKDVTIDGSYLGTGITVTTADNVYDRIFYVDTGTVNMRGLTLTNRTTDRQKAGENASDLTIDQGGAIYVRAGNLTMFNILIYDCMAKQGAAVYMADGQKVSLELVNMTIVNNTATAADGAVIYSNAGNLAIKNTIIVKNDADQDVYKGTVSRTYTNGVYSYNTQIYNSFVEYSDSLALFHSGNVGNAFNTFTGNYVGYSTTFASVQYITNNQSYTTMYEVVPVDLTAETERLFVDVDNNDFNLKDDSLAVNTGSNAFVTNASAAYGPNLDEIDLATNRRTVGRYVDMGAFENQKALDFYLSDAYSMVTTSADIVDPTDGLVSLREAVSFVQRVYDIGLTNLIVTFDANLLGSNPTMKLDTQSILINRPITIDATEVSNFTVNGQRMNNVFRVSLDPKFNNDEVVIKNMTLYNGYELSGGGAIYHESGNLKLLNLLIHTSEGTYGGGILSESGSLTLVNCTVANNKSYLRDGNGGLGGGLYVKNSDVVLYNTILAKNYAEAFNSDVYFNGGSYVFGSSFVGNAGTEALKLAFEASGTGNQIGWGDDNSLDPKFLDLSGGNFQTYLSSPVVAAGNQDYLFDVVYVEKTTLTEGTVVFYESINEDGEYVSETLIIQNNNYNVFSAFLTDQNTEAKYPIQNALQVDEVVTFADGSLARYLGNVSFMIVSSPSIPKNTIVTLQEGDRITTVDGTDYQYSIQLLDVYELEKGEKLTMIDGETVTVFDHLTVTIDSTAVTDQIIEVDLNGVDRVQDVANVIKARTLILNGVGTIFTPDLLDVKTIMYDTIDEISLAQRRQEYLGELYIPLMEDLTNKINTDAANMEEARAIDTLLTWARLNNDIAVGDTLNQLEAFFNDITDDGKTNNQDYSIYTFFVQYHGTTTTYNAKEVAAWGLKWLTEYRATLSAAEQLLMTVNDYNQGNNNDGYLARLTQTGRFALAFQTYIANNNLQTVSQVEDKLEESTDLGGVLNYITSAVRSVANQNRRYTFSYTIANDYLGNVYTIIDKVEREVAGTGDTTTLVEVSTATYQELYQDLMAKIESDALGGTDIGAYQRAGTEEEPSLVVTTLDDIVDPYDGLISLREAIQYVYQYRWDNISNGGIGYVGADGYGVAAGIPVSGPYHATDAMSNSAVYANTYLYPITFDASLAGGTIFLQEELEIYTPNTGGTRTFDYMIDATSLADNGGITIDAGGNNAFVIGRRNGMDFDGETERDYNSSVPWYETTLLDIRGVTVKNANTAFTVNYFGLLYMRNCLVYSNNTGVVIQDNDNNYGGVAHIYSSTIQKNRQGINIGGAAYLYNTITDYVNVMPKTVNPAYRQCNAFNTYFTGGYGGLGRYTLTDCITGTNDYNDVFINYREDDYRLNRFSVAVNTGTETYLATYLPYHADPETDIDGDDRVCGKTVDIGCYESLYVNEVPSTVVTTELDVVADDGLTSLREAIAYAQQQASGQLVSNTITFDATMLNKTITLVNGPLQISRYYLRIDGGSANVTIDGNGVSRVFDINMFTTQANVPNVYMYNLTLKKGYSKNNGGAINIGKGNVYLQGVNITQSEASGWGGAIYAYDSELTLLNVKIGGNKAAYYGGVVNQYGTTLIGQSVIAENTGTIGKEDVFGKVVRNYYTIYGTYGYNVIGVGGNISILDGQDNCRVGTIANPLKPFVDAANGDLTVKSGFILTPQVAPSSVNVEEETDELFRDLGAEEVDLLLDDDLVEGLFGEMI